MGSQKRDGKLPGSAAQHVMAEERKSGPGLDRIIQAQIGDKLRSMYGELVEQPVPDRLTSILDRLTVSKTAGR